MKFKESCKESFQLPNGERTDHSVNNLYREECGEVTSQHLELFIVVQSHFSCTYCTLFRFITALNTDFVINLLIPSTQ